MPSPASPLSPDAQQAAALIPPDDIEARSFAIIDGEIPEPRPFTGYAWDILHLIHFSYYQKQKCPSKQVFHFFFLAKHKNFFTRYMDTYFNL